MSTSRFKRSAVQAVLRELGPTFFTKEVSRHPAMLAAHPQQAQHSHYHAFVGKFLSRECDDVRIIEGQKHKQHGERWQNLLTGATVASTVVAEPSAQSFGAFDLGPQYSGDNAFTARVRRHMSWYRAAVLGVPCGTGPKSSDVSFYGNMLTRADGERGLNFLTPEIHRVALARAAEGGTVEPFRLMHNMLSSQPMCFNLFGPLVNDLDLATTLFRTLPELRVERVISVKLEYAPMPKGEYLGDKTTFDAIVVYKRTDGTCGFFGFETKLTDSFSAKHYDSPKYWRWLDGERSPFSSEVAAQQASTKHNQLFRDQLLAIAMRDHAQSPYVHGRLVLVGHPQDRSCAAAARQYRELLQPEEYTFLELTLDRLVEHWQRAPLDEARRAWLQAFRQRYLDLESSEAL